MPGNEGRNWPVETVLCWRCGVKQPAASDSCAACHTNFRQLCGCGASARFDSTACAACGGALSPSRFDVAKSRRRKIGRAIAAAAGIAALVAVSAELLGEKPPPPWKLVDDAVAAHGGGDRERALRLATQAAGIAPRNARAWLLKGICEQELGFDASVSIASFARAYELDPTTPDIGRAYAASLLGANRASEALSVLTGSLEFQPTDTGLLTMHAEACLRSTPPLLREAGRSLAVARANGADGLELRLKRAIVGIALFGDPPAAERPQELTTILADAESAISTSPTRDWAVAYSLPAAHVLLALKRYEEATAVARRAMEATAEPSQIAELRTILGTAALRSGDIDVAGSEFAAALAAAPTASTVGVIIEQAERAGLRDRAAQWLGEATKDPLGDIRAARAALLVSDGRLDDAGTLVSEAIEADGTQGRRHLLLGDVRAAQGRDDEARAAWRRAAERGCRVAAAGHEAMLAMRQGVASADRDRVVSAAIETIRGEVESGTAGADGWACLAQLSFAIGRIDDALAQAERALREAPSRVDMILLFAATSAAQGTPEAWARAARALATAQALRPKLLGFAEAQARARFICGDLAMAVTFASASLRQEPDRADMLVLRARCFAASSNWRGAVDDFSHAWKLVGRRDPWLFVSLVDALCRSNQAAVARAEFEAARLDLPVDVKAEVESLLGLTGDGPAPAAPTAADASVRMDAGDVQGALLAARAVLANDPGDPRATFIAVMSLLERGDFDARKVTEARGLFASISQKAARPMVDLIEGRILLAEDRPGEAAAALARAATAMPDDAVVAFLRGEALIRSGQEDDGLAQLRRAMRLSSANAAIRRQVATRLVTISQSRAADRREELVREASLIAPDDPAVNDKLIELLLARGDAESALSRAEALLDKGGLSAAWATRLRWRAMSSAFAAGWQDRAARHLEALPATEQDTGRAWMIRGALRLAREDADGARPAFERAHRMMPDDPEPIVALAQTLVRLDRAGEASQRVDDWSAAHPSQTAAALAFARMLAASGRLDDAIVRARRCVESSGGDDASLRHLSNFLIRRGLRGEGIAVLRRRAESRAAGAAARARLDLGQAILVCGGDPAEALLIARGAIGAEARMLESEALAAQGDDPSAAKLAEATLATLEPQDRQLIARARFLLGAVAYRAGNAAVAAKLFTECIASDPLHVNATNNLAWILSGDPLQAARAAEISARATSLAPYDANVWDTHGVCARAVGRSAVAEAAWRRALELLAADPAADRAARGRVAMRLVLLLDLNERDVEARALAEQVVGFADGTPPGAEAARFLASR